MQNEQIRRWSESSWSSSMDEDADCPATPILNPSNDPLAPGEYILED